jgi:two-component system, NtrC family, response regulator AtoC
MSHILVVDDEKGIRTLCAEVLKRGSHEVTLAETGEEGLKHALARDFDLILADVNLPGIDGIEMLNKIRASKADAIVILITGFPSIEDAVRGMKEGARDYITKPFSPDELRLVVARALEEQDLRRENIELRNELAFGNLIGRSQKMRDMRSTIEKVARTDATVLIMGDSGTGKELCARAVHYHGPRANKPFVAVNCGALVANLLESELFGHVRGAFTGADSSKHGLFVAANGGTLFLDEIGELPIELQPKLLRSLQEGEIKPVGGTTTTKVDVRVIAATNRDLATDVQQGRFREDLYYRLNVIALEVPPLRERREDIPILVEFFIARAAERSRRPRLQVSERAMEWLMQQRWQGNVRELENAVERAVVLASGRVLDVEDFAPRGTVTQLQPAASKPTTPEEYPFARMSLEELERAHIQRVLELCNGQKARAAAILGINRTTLWKKLRQYGVE